MESKDSRGGGGGEGSHCLLLPQPGYVYWRELRAAAMNFKMSGFTVLPRPPLDGPGKKH